MASKRERQRKLERARAERRLARQAHKARRRRQTQAIVAGALALLLIVLGTTWLLGGFDPKPADNVVRGTCTWTTMDFASHPNLTEVGHPPATGERREGTETLTIKTNLGVIEAEMDLAKAPCTAASLAHLGRTGFYAGNICHQLNTNFKTVTCGDPRGDGSGGPTYQFAAEDVPLEPLADPAATPGATPTASPDPSPAAEDPTYYAKGTIVMFSETGNTNGSQFSIIYDDNSPLSNVYSVVGRVTQGLDIVEKVARAGLAEGEGGSDDDPPATGGKPKTDLIIEELYVGARPDPSATPSAPASPAASAPPTPQS